MRARLRLSRHPTQLYYVAGQARGSHPKMAQSPARHSTIGLTMDRYTPVGLNNQAAALKALPSILSARPKAEAPTLAATGTEGSLGPESWRSACASNDGPCASVMAVDAGPREGAGRSQL